MNNGALRHIVVDTLNWTGHGVKPAHTFFHLFSFEIQRGDSGDTLPYTPLVHLKQGLSTATRGGWGCIEGGAGLPGNTDREEEEKESGSRKGIWR